MKIESLGEEHRKITAIKAQQKNQNRVNIFIDGKYNFSLDIAQLVDFKLKMGQELSPAKLEELKKASGFGKLYARTLEWVLMRPHSTKETREYLFRKKADKEDAQKIIETLTARQYLDDAKFARAWAENRFTSKGISQKRLRQELRQKGIDTTTIEEVLESTTRNDQEELAKIIAKKRTKYQDPQKLIAYLVRQGFDYQSSSTAVLAETDSQNSA